jgi:hypothetical protein
MTKLIAIGLTVSFSCTPAKETMKTEITRTVHTATIQSDNRFDESFDPLTLNDETWVIKKKFRRTQNLNVVPDSAGINLENDKIKEPLVFGFRVQLYSTTDYFMAMSVRDEAGGKLKENIYVDYEPPYYKVRAGNFTEREKAEDLKNLSKLLGYTEAWIIRTNVLIKEK